MPSLSVVMPVYNCRAYLADAIASVRQQTFTGFELIIVDDGSTDGSAKIMDAAAAADARLHIIRRPNTGLVGDLNAGLAVARGAFIARMDADDLCAPHRLATQFRFLEENESYAAVGSAVDVIDPAGRRLKTMRLPPAHDDIVQELLAGNGGAMIHPAVMFRASAIAAVSGYDPAFAGYGEDWDIFLRLSAHGQLANLAEVLLQYRMHPQSYNHTRRGEQVRTYLAAVNQARRQHDLGAITTLPWSRSMPTPAAIHRLWAEWAIEGAEHRTARFHGFMALLHAPTDRASWRFLKYSAGLQTR